MNKIELLAKIAAMKAAKEAKATEVPPKQETPKIEVVRVLRVKPTNNVEETPEMLRKLLGIVETIEESNDDSETALLKASEQVEKCKAYIVYLKSILPILEAKVDAMIERKHKPNAIHITQDGNFKLN